MTGEQKAEAALQSSEPGRVTPDRVQKWAVVLESRNDGRRITWRGEARDEAVACGAALRANPGSFVVAANFQGWTRS